MLRKKKIDQDLEVLKALYRLGSVIHRPRDLRDGGGHPSLSLGLCDTSHLDATARHTERGARRGAGEVLLMVEND